MSAYAPPALNAYRDSAVLTASPAQLVVMLYDGAHRFLTQSAIDMRDGRVALAGE
jgi:flagellar protein FliS